MKILELRFKNLNSLYGEWILDFTDPEYLSNGIFALTGPTGAGKSTILDALCLALYGATPRLGKITKSSNDIMSRQTGECYAEVLFESREGVFRCHWEQRRARKNAEGNLQDQEHQIAREDGQLIETKKSLVLKVIEEKTGMDFERFTRSILLAQGGFDTFLKAELEEKSRLLEQITGTEIYSEISRRTHERLRDEREKLTVLQAETSTITVLDPEQEKELVEEQERHQAALARLNLEHNKTAEAIRWLNSLEELKREVGTLSAESEDIEKRAKEFEPEKRTLTLAEKAGTLDGVYAVLQGMRRQLEKNWEELTREETALADLDKSAKSQGEFLKKAEEAVGAAKNLMKEMQPRLQKARLLDQKLGELNHSIQGLRDNCRRDSAALTGDRNKKAEFEELKIRSEEKQNGFETYLQKNSQDDWLVSGLTGVEEKLETLLSRRKGIEEKVREREWSEAALQKASRKLENSRKSVEVCRLKTEEEKKGLTTSREGYQKHLGERVLREYRAEKEALFRERELLKKIEELESHRAHLEDGKPCPLCGAEEHPYARGNVPVPDEIDRKIAGLNDFINRAEDLESEIRKRESCTAEAEKSLKDCEKMEALAESEWRSAEAFLKEQQESLEKLKGDFVSLKEVVLEILVPFGILEIQESGIEALRRNLRGRQEKWQETVKARAAADQNTAEILSEIKRLDAVIETKTSALEEFKNELEAQENQQKQIQKERADMLGEKDPDQEEARLQKSLSDAEDTEKQCREKSSLILEKLAGLRANRVSLEKRISEGESALHKRDEEFLLKLKAAGFSREAEYLDASIPLKERESLARKALELEESLVELRTKKKDRETRLEMEKSRKITDLSREVLERQFRESEENLNTFNDLIAGIRHRLNENRIAREKRETRLAGIEAQRKEVLRWDKLHSLIGSSDGKKYRNFAQGLTFDLMVTHANRQLEKMTDRYLLIRDDQQPLELNVIDNYQAGEIRSTRNLSGGESFIVSLSLALGLSRMASRKVRVDSLFLDEGFGTLDEDALETALETLSSLQQEGKLIGIISHVTALKERIPTQITISPVAGGRSGVSGPGCSRVS